MTPSAPTMSHQRTRGSAGTRDPRRGAAAKRSTPPKPMPAAPIANAGTSTGTTIAATPIVPHRADATATAATARLLAASVVTTTRLLVRATQASTLSGMEWIWLVAILLVGALVALVVVA